MDSILALLLLAGSCVFFLLHRSLLQGTFCLSVAAGCIGALVGNAALWQCLLIFAGSYVLLAVVALIFLWTICALVDLDKPQEHDSKFYRSVMYLYIEALITLVRVKLETRGLENTPKALFGGVQPFVHRRSGHCAALLPEKSAGIPDQEGKLFHAHYQ